MTKYLSVAASLLLLVSNAAFAQHGGTEPEQRACGNVQRYCRPILNEGDFAVLACLQQHRENLSAACKKVLIDHGQ
jgi:hypothetical protein